MDFAVITLLKFYSFKFMQEYVRLFFAAQGTEHLLSQYPLYPAAEEGFDNIYKTESLHVQGLGARLTCMAGARKGKGEGKIGRA